MKHLGSLLLRWIRALLLWAGAGFSLLALVTYSPNDPSWNTAIDASPQNILGMSGALWADVMMQCFGVMSAVFALYVFFVGLDIVRGASRKQFLMRGLGFLLAFVFLVLSQMVSCGFIMTSVIQRLENLAPVLSSIFLRISFLVGGGFVLLVASGVRLRWSTILYGIRQSFQFLSLVYYYLRSWVVFLQKYRQARPQTIMSPPKACDVQEDDSPVLVAPLAPSAPPSFKELKKYHIVSQEQEKAALRTSSESLDTSSHRHQLPPLSLIMEKGAATTYRMAEDDLQRQAQKLHQVLGEFGIRGKITQVNPGPVVTLYELEPAAGLKTSRVIGLADDIARSMSAVSARVSVIPGRNVIGIELPNEKRNTVALGELLSRPEYEKTQCKLALALGKNIGGKPVIADLSKMPHLLVAGTTGSGKSVGVNAMILSLIYRLPPDRCKFIMIDPKMLELSVYNGIPHLLSPVVTDPKKAITALKWTVRTMEDRYRSMSQLGVRNIENYNQRVIAAQRAGEQLTRRVQTGFDDAGRPVYEDQNLDLKPLPFIVVVVDEMADLMLVAGKDIEAAVQRLAQMARAAGIHLIMATQRPSVDVITGTIKANFPTRISFQVTSKIDSRTILGEQGAEQLLGQGDMLYMATGGRVTRVHGPFVSDHAVEQVVRFLASQGEPEYIDAIQESDDDQDWEGDMIASSDKNDQLYQQAIDIVRRDRKASTSYVQRRLEIGYNRAARLIERMEKEGIVSAANHAGKREVI